MANVLLQRELLKNLADTKRYKTLLASTIALAKKILSQSQKPYIAFSGGKDSTVLLSIVRAIDSSVVALMNHEEWLYPETTEFIETIPNLVKIISPLYHSQFFTSWGKGKPNTLPSNSIWFDPGRSPKAYHFIGVQGWARKENYDCAFIGLRKEEAKYREIHLSKHGKFFYCNADKINEANILADWSVEDIWTYLLANKVPYNRVYDRLCELNIPLHLQRVGPLAVDRVLGFGQMAVLKRGWPDLFNSFVAACPEAANYA